MYHDAYIKQEKKTKKDKIAYVKQNAFIRNPTNIPVPEINFFFSPNSTLVI